MKYCPFSHSDTMVSTCAEVDMDAFKQSTIQAAERDEQQVIEEAVAEVAAVQKVFTNPSTLHHRVGGLQMICCEKSCCRYTTVTVY